MSKQVTIPGTKRPSIEVIDEAIFDLLEIEREIANLKMRREEALCLVDQRILEHSEKLELNDKSQPTYVFEDEGMQRPFVVHSRVWIKMGKATRVEVE